MERHEAIRRAAQHALLDALRRLCPEPLVELRDGLPAVLPLPAKNDSPPRVRSRVAATIDAPSFDV